MTTKIIFHNGTSITLEGSRENSVWIPIYGTVWTVTDKGHDGARLESVEGYDDPIELFSKPNWSVEGSAVGAKDIKEITYTRPERK